MGQNDYTFYDETAEDEIEGDFKKIEQEFDARDPTPIRVINK